MIDAGEKKKCGGGLGKKCDPTKRLALWNSCGPGFNQLQSIIHSAKIQDTRYKIQDTRYKIQDIANFLIYANAK
jgi:hypothetical protein